MELKRLIVKNYGSIKDLDFKPNSVVNCVSEPLSNAICHVLNNQFAIRHYNTVELSDNTYLFGEICHYEKGKQIIYTTEINGLDAPIFTKNGQVLTEDAVDSDPVLSRPYREDNACIFSARAQDGFFDYDKFMPYHFSHMTEYAKSFKDCLETKPHNCNASKGHAVYFNKGKRGVYKRGRRPAFSPVLELSEIDRLCVRYVTYLLLAEMIDYHRILKSKAGMSPRTPIVVNGLLSCLEMDGVNRSFLVSRTKECARQIFFVEK